MHRKYTIVLRTHLEILVVENLWITGFWQTSLSHSLEAVSVRYMRVWGITKVY